MVLVRYRDYLYVERIVCNAHPLHTFIILIIQNYPKLMSIVNVFLYLNIILYYHS